PRGFFARGDESLLRTQLALADRIAGRGRTVLRVGGGGDDRRRQFRFFCGRSGRTRVETGARRNRGGIRAGAVSDLAGLRSPARAAAAARPQSTAPRARGVSATRRRRVRASHLDGRQAPVLGRRPRRGDRVWRGARSSGRVGPARREESIERAILDFRRFADHQDRVPLFYEVLEPDLHRFHDLGFDLFKLGELATVPLSEFSLAGKRWEDLRAAVNRALRENLHFQIVEPPFDTSLLDDLQRVSE